MPGLVGLYSNKLSQTAVENTVKRMREKITHKLFYSFDPVYSGQGLAASRSHINVVNTTPQPATADHVFVWLDGEIHNRNDFETFCGNNNVSDASFILQLYQTTNDFSFLKKIDGGFSAVIFDSNREKIFLISDRYSRQQLNWLLYEHGFAWSTEIKSFTEIPGLNIQIDKRAVEEFLGMGYMMGEQTWFENVYLMPAATVLIYDLKKHTIRKKRYWWWDELKPFNGKLNIDELATHTGDLFIESVQKLNSLTFHKPGVTLSGGRDSRAIFAAISENEDPIPVVTFGKRNSLDVIVASQIAQKKNTHHYLHILNEENWFQDRLKGIWWTDGQTSFIHMHGIASGNGKDKLFDVVFNGLPGEIIAGKIRHFEMFEIEDYIHRLDKYGLFSDSFKDRFRSYIESMGCPEIYSLNHRFRNFGLVGIKQGEAGGVRTRLPFLENKLLEFVYRIPHEYKKSEKLYDTMLLLKFRDYFKDLYALNPNMRLTLADDFYYQIKVAKKMMNKVLAKCGFQEQIIPSIASYENWMRSEPECIFFRELLYNKNALYPEFIEKETAIQCYESHMEGDKNTTLLSRFLTFEIWLQQVFNRKYLD